MVPTATRSARRTRSSRGSGAVRAEAPLAANSSSAAARALRTLRLRSDALDLRVALPLEAAAVLDELRLELLAALASLGRRQRGELPELALVQDLQLGELGR